MILIAPDKFKGTMSSREAAEAISRGLRRAGVRAELRSVMMADGGEGTPLALGAEPIVDVPGAYELPGGDALVMSCELCGPGLEERAPELRSSSSLGRAVLQLAGKAYPRIYIGVGGTRTADGGAGFLQALGWRFYDSQGDEILTELSPSELRARGLSRAVAPEMKFPEIVGLCDVACPILPLPSSGELSAMDFIRQKGFVSASQIECARTALQLIRTIVESSTARFGGAGGGLGYAVGAIDGAECRFGAEFVIDKNIGTFRCASLIITGEGCIDAQTSGGKCVEAVRRFGAGNCIPVLAIGGRVLGGKPDRYAISCVSPDSPVPGRDAAQILEETVANWAAYNLPLCI